jgi:hypothetical protein
MAHVTFQYFITVRIHIVVFGLMTRCSRWVLTLWRNILPPSSFTLKTEAVCSLESWYLPIRLYKKLRGFGPLANYADRATAAY